MPLDPNLPNVVFTNDELEEELKGNVGRATWNSQPQSAKDAQQMLDGAIHTIDRLIRALLNRQGRFFLA